MGKDAQSLSPLTAVHIGRLQVSSSGLVTNFFGNKLSAGHREIDMATLNVMRWGNPADCKMIVGLHGITASAGAMTEPARMLASRGWHFIAPDMRGHGESTRANGDFSFESLLADFAENVPPEPDLLIGHSFGGTLAQLAVLRGIMSPKSLLLEDPVSHLADKETPTEMLDWDEVNLPRSIDDLHKLNPKWSRLDASWKLLSLEQVDFDDASAAFVGNAPWDLRPHISTIIAKVPTVWVLAWAQLVLRYCDEPSWPKPTQSFFQLHHRSDGTHYW